MGLVVPAVESSFAVDKAINAPLIRFLFRTCFQGISDTIAPLHA